MLEKVKRALRVTVAIYDDEIQSLIDAALADLGIAGIMPATTDALVLRAVCTYARMNFGSPDDYDKLKASYDEQKAQLSMATGYTDWGDA